MDKIIKSLCVAATVPLVLAAGAPAGAATDPDRAGSKWQPVASYCSGSGDVCYGIQRRGDHVRLRLDSFVDFGTVAFCVRKARQSTYVCQDRDLVPGAHSLYTAKIRWNGNYPTSGGQKRVVSFTDYPKTLSFRP